MSTESFEEFTRSLSRRRRRHVARELRSHLEASQRDLERAGMSSADAAHESRLRLGEPEEVAAEFGRLDRPSRRRRIGFALVLSGSLLVGAYGFSGTLASATSAHRSPPARAYSAVTPHHCSRHR